MLYSIAVNVQRAILADLPADVLLCIFALVDVYGIISLGQTCKSLYSLAFSKSVWLNVLADLKRRGFVDEATTPDITALSAEELIDCAKRLAIGPSTWTPAPDGTFVPRVRTQRVVWQQEATGEDFAYWSAARLLPGGRYIMAVLDCRLAAWDIIQDRRVQWNLDFAANTAAVLVWDAKRSGDNEHTFIVAHSTWERSDLCMVHITEVNLSSGAQTKYLSTEFEMDKLSLQSDFCVLTDVRSAIILHWRSHTAVKLQCGARNSLLRLALIPGYAVILLSALDRPDNMFILNEATLREHLAPFTSLLLVECLNVEGLLPSARLMYKFEGVALPPNTNFQYAQTVTLAVCPSPLAPDEYRVWVTIRKRGSFRMSNTTVARMYSLRLRVFRSRKTNENLQLCLRTSTSMPSEGGWKEDDEPTFSGHSSSITRNMGEIQAFVICATYLAVVGGKVLLPKVPGSPPPDIDVSPHAGTWLCRFQKQLVVLYFE
ncbi:hypothetical protein MSAN_02105300 [Mycena sanguinolenta]|uniref:F-box domain-containing protein n=1 Tax=Mycena sanguinolenta TaxID=230812 RepID=A0A8H7CLW6_9AGAR|nr:hypothetical protein MSAN_02105300 [Mycena sanguinolenta]